MYTRNNVHFPGSRKRQCRKLEMVLKKGLFMGNLIYCRQQSYKCSTSALGRDKTDISLILNNFVLATCQWQNIFST